ncbi:MAG TPA: hypothetical protein VIK69_05460 [Methylophilaceae bacterium]
MTMTRNDCGPDGKSREHWLEQAELAWDYALRRPASDLDGFFASLRDREEFLRLAASATPAWRDEVASADW